MISKKENIKCECQYSDDLKHRFTLKRCWNKNLPTACILTIHPNFSENINMDMTTFLTINGIVNLDQYGSVILVNLFSLITNKLQMRWARDMDINHPENDNYIKKAAEESSVILLAYGRGVLNNARILNRVKQLLDVLSDHKDKFMVISDGEREGLHPLTPSTRSIVWKLVPFDPSVHLPSQKSSSENDTADTIDEPIEKESNTESVPT